MGNIRSQTETIWLYAKEGYAGKDLNQMNLFPRTFSQHRQIL